MGSTVNPIAANPFGTQPPAPTGSTSGAGSSSSASGPTTQVTEQQFLQLLVAQLQYQDPTNPADPTQFVTQLAQFSELEQMIGVNQGVQQLVQDLGGLQTGSTGAPGSTPPPGGTTGNTSSGAQPLP